MAMTANVPILPMSIIGMDDIWENWFKGVKPNLNITIGKPFNLGDIPTKKIEREEALKKAGEEIMQKIGALIPEALHGEPLPEKAEPLINN